MTTTTPSPGTEPAPGGPAAPAAAPATRLYVATPCYGCMMTNMFAASMIALQGACMQRGIECVVDFIGNESLVQRARNVLTARFARSPSTHLLFVDADIGFSPDAVFRALGFDRDVVCVAYPKKYIDWDNVRKKLAAGDDEPVFQMGLDFNVNIKGARADCVDGFVRVLDSATGFMLIKRGVVDRMIEAYRPTLYAVNDIIGDVHGIKDYVALFDCMIDPETKRYLSEDYAFCRRWQQLGGEIWVDVASPLCHAGNMMFHGDVRTRMRVTCAPVLVRSARAA